MNNISVTFSETSLRREIAALREASCPVATREGRRARFGARRTATATETATRPLHFHNAAARGGRHAGGAPHRALDSDDACDAVAVFPRRRREGRTSRGRGSRAGARRMATATRSLYFRDSAARGGHRAGGGCGQVAVLPRREGRTSRGRGSRAGGRRMATAKRSRYFRGAAARGGRRVI